jgi:hypothetical protein
MIAIRILTTVFFFAAVLHAQIPQRSFAGQAANPAQEYKSVEYLLLGDATRGAGEPMIAVDPTNPQNIVVTAMGTLFQLPPAPPGSQQNQRAIPRATIPWHAVTHDGGATWKIGELPILDGVYPRCPDPVTDVTKEGVFLAGCAPREVTGAWLGMSAIVASSDKGISWGPRVEMISAFAPARFAPGLKPSMNLSSPWDRPFTFIDDSTNVIYGTSFGNSLAISGTDPQKTRKQAYLTASTDGGKKFGTIYSWDSKDYPQSGNSIGFAASHGVVSVLYEAGSVPATENATCPCYALGHSRDQGKEFSYRILKNISPPPQAETAAASGGPGVVRAAEPVLVVAPVPSGTPNVLTADPTKPGRYALLMIDGRAKLEWKVIVSEDYGKTWSAPVTAGGTPEAINYTKAVIEYSREGVLGLMWKAVYADGSFDVWASISRDGGKSFSNSMRVSHAKSPGSLAVKGSGNDDISDLYMDKDSIHMVWGDYRSGFLGSWYGKVALSAFEFPTH